MFKYFSRQPEILIRSDFNGDGVAVLTFAKQGNISSDIGKITADNLSDAFFLKNKYNIIDRSKINDAQAALEIKSPDLLSIDQIQQIGLKLKANYLVLGRIQYISDNEFLNDDMPEKLYLSFRILSIKEGDVVGVANYMSELKDDNPVEKIKEMTCKITEGLKN